MADEKTEQTETSVTEERDESPTQEAETTPSESSQDGQGEQPDWWAEAQTRGFKDQQTVWKSYREAEKKISSQGERIKAAETFENQVAPFIETVWGDPELLKQVQAKMGIPTDNSAPTKTSKSDDAPSQTPTDSEVRTYLRNEAISKFESSKGLDNFDAETQKDIRTRIGNKLSSWGKDLRSTDINQLPTLLDDALIAVVNSDPELKRTFETSKPAQAPGVMPSMGAQGQSSDTIKLSSAQKAVADKMGISYEKYAEGLKKTQG